MLIFALSIASSNDAPLLTSSGSDLPRRVSISRDSTTNSFFPLRTSAASFLASLSRGARFVFSFSSIVAACRSSRSAIRYFTPSQSASSLSADTFVIANFISGSLMTANCFSARAFSSLSQLSSVEFKALTRKPTTRSDSSSNIRMSAKAVRAFSYSFVTT